MDCYIWWSTPLPPPHTHPLIWSHRSLLIRGPKFTSQHQCELTVHTSLYGGSVLSILLTPMIICLTPRVKASNACSLVWPFLEIPASNSPVPAATMRTAQSACDVPVNIKKYLMCYGPVCLSGPHQAGQFTQVNCISCFCTSATSI